MGINLQVLKSMLHENEHKPIDGSVLLIGKSTVGVNFATIQSLASSYGIKIDSTYFKTHDVVTKRSSQEFWVDDAELIKILFQGVESIDILDVSPYEGANVIADMNLPLPIELRGKYDFIYDSSVLDNIFNPAQMIQNAALMLRESGRFLSMNVASFYPGAMTSCHPEWFYAFFAVNNFRDVKVYLTVQRNPTKMSALTDLWRYKPFFTPSTNYDYLDAVRSCEGIAHTIVLAEAGGKVEEPMNFPVNLQYINSSGALDWSSSENEFVKSRRPIMRGEPAEEPTRPHLTDHYEFLGSQF